MEIRQGMVRFPIWPIALGAIGAMFLLALALFVLATLSGLPRTTHSSPLVAPTIVTSPEEPVNAPERTK
jgi:hypothetical protein